MFAVIFRAEINAPDESYYETAMQLRKLAMTKYGCSEFISVSEGNSEIAISYWPSQEQISQWKQDAQHLMAQQRGAQKWYTSYQVQVVEIIREYSKPA